MTSKDLVVIDLDDSDDVEVLDFSTAQPTTSKDTKRNDRRKSNRRMSLADPSRCRSVYTTDPTEFPSTETEIVRFDEQLQNLIRFSTPDDSGCVDDSVETVRRQLNEVYRLAASATCHSLASSNSRRHSIRPDVVDNANVTVREVERISRLVSDRLLQLSWPAKVITDKVDNSLLRLLAELKMSKDIELPSVKSLIREYCIGLQTEYGQWKSLLDEYYDMYRSSRAERSHLSKRDWRLDDCKGQSELMKDPTWTFLETFQHRLNQQSATAVEKAGEMVDTLRTHIETVDTSTSQLHMVEKKLASLTVRRIQDRQGVTNYSDEATSEFQLLPGRTKSVLMPHEGVIRTPLATLADFVNTL